MSVACGANTMILPHHGGVSAACREDNAAGACEVNPRREPDGCEADVQANKPEVAIWTRSEHVPGEQARRLNGARSNQGFRCLHYWEDSPRPERHGAFVCSGIIGAWPGASLPSSTNHLGEDSAGFIPQVIIHVLCRVHHADFVGNLVGFFNLDRPDDLFDLRDVVGSQAQLPQPHA